MTGKASSRAKTWRSALRVAGIVSLLFAAEALVPRPVPAEAAVTPLRTVLVDVSGSVRRTRPAWASWVRRRLEEEARGARERGEHLLVASFARTVGRGFGPGAPSAFLRKLHGEGSRPFDPLAGAGADDASDLAGGLDLVTGLLRADSGAIPEGSSLVLLGDGTWTGRDPAPAWFELHRAGVSPRRVAVPPAELTDLALLDCVLPEEVEEGAPLVALVRVGIRSGTQPPATCRLRLRLEQASGSHVSERRVELPPGRDTLECAVALGPAEFGRNEVWATVLPADPTDRTGGRDPVPENDRHRTVAHAQGELEILVAAAPDLEAAARAWLTPAGSSLLPGIQFRFTDPGELPLVLPGADALVTFDLPCNRLPGILLERFVERGGGWLATSGSRFLNDWIPAPAGEAGAPSSAVQRLLPLEPAPPDGGRREVLLLVDGSGSMDGAPFEMVRAAALDLVEAALPTDRVVLRFFTVGLSEPHVVKPWTEGAASDRAAAVEAARRLVDFRVPSGDTWILASLEKLAVSRRGAAEPALVLLLTDGFDRGDTSDLEERVGKLRTDLAATRTRLVPIAIGEDADMEFLNRLAGSDEPALRPADREALAQLFRRTVEGARCREGERLELSWAPAAEGSIPARLAGSSPREVGPVERFVKNRLASGGGENEILWQADRGEPVLAVGRRGLGRTALFGTLPVAGWAADFSGRPGLGEPARFGPLLRFLARGPARRGEGPRLVLERGTAARFLLTGLETQGAGQGDGGTGWDWPPEVTLEVLLGADASEPAFTIALDPPVVDPAHDPRTTRSAPAPLGRLRALAEEGLILLRVRAPGPDGTVAILQPFEPGPVAEYDPGAVGWLPDASHGGGDGPPATPGTRDAIVRAQTRLAPKRSAPFWLVLGALLVFLGFAHLPRLGAADRA